MEARGDRYGEALDDFDRAYKSDPGNADFCFNRGVTLWNLHHYQAAAESLEEAIQLNAGDSEAHTLLAAVAGKLGDAASEKAQLEWLAQHEAGSEAKLSRDVLPQPRLEKNFDGRAFRLLSLTVHNALEERLVSLSSDEHAAVHQSRAKKLVSEGRLSEAERELAEASSLMPGDSPAHLSLAQILEEEGKYQEAIDEFRAALKLQENVVGHLGVARVYMSMGQPEQARKEAELASKLDPGNQEAQKVIQETDPHASPAKK